MTRSINILPDGRLHLVLRQSNITTYVMCPEKARRELYDPQPQRWTDLTALGTAVHAGIEHGLRELQDDTFAPLDELIEVARLELDTIGTWQTTKFNNGQMFDMIDRLLDVWHDEHYGTYRPARIEQKFELPFVDTDWCRIDLHGTPDVEDTDGIVHDHKTAGRAYSPDAWQRQRSAVQPTAYLWAAWTRDNGDEPMPTRLFQYDVLIHSGKAESVPITRDQSHVDWLRAQALQIARMIHADIAPWPQIDSGWWCSEKWCDAFAAGECKGAHMIADRWLRPQVAEVSMPTVEEGERL